MGRVGFEPSVRILLFGFILLLKTHVANKVFYISRCKKKCPKVMEHQALRIGFESLRDNED
jgi:hypothetical protein